MKYIQKIMLALVALVLATGCIKEDFDDCDNVTIYFQYLADGDEDVLYKYMKKVDLYVFDENGNIMGVGHYNEDELKTFSAKPSFKLQTGRKYKVVAVGNAYERTEVVNLQTETDFDEIFLQHPDWGTNEEVDGHDHNYMGQKEFYIPEGEFVVHRETVTLYSEHIDVYIEINGLPAPEETRNADQPFELRIYKSNAQTDFNGDINTEEKGTCYPDLVYDYERKCYRTNNLALFRIDNENGQVDLSCCEHELVLIDNSNAREGSGDEMLRGKLYNLLNVLNQDITKQEAELAIVVNFDGANVDITIPDWVVVDGKPELN